MANDSITLINDTDPIGYSQPVINDNFKTLHDIACDIETTISTTTEVRTFFFYGPNSATDSESRMDKDHTSRPSNTTIENFINIDLQLIPESQAGDIAYVVYQKTGWYSHTAVSYRSGVITTSYTYYTQEPVYGKIGINWGMGYTYLAGYQNVSHTNYANHYWKADINDQYKYYAPVFIVYKLTSDGTLYKVDDNYPKFTRAATNSTENWNNPTAWSIY
jgi:hypothetical protein